jgi:mannan endo-1,4-beta-mannosidase
MLFLLSLLVTVCVAVPAMHRAPERTIPKANGLYFEFDGEKRYFAGTNAYWLSYLQINSDVDLVLDHMAEAQLRIVRIWGFNDAKVVPTNGMWLLLFTYPLKITDDRLGSVWFQAFNGTGEPVINTGANGLQRLDYAIRAAETRGIKFIIPFVNNWNDYGGMEAYYPYCVNLNSTTPPNEQWYTNKKCQDQYQKYLKAIVVRHRDSPAVFAWELANEPRCNGCNQTVVTEWARKTSRYIKSLDSKHMVAVGDEGFGLQVNTTAMDSSSEYPYLFQEGTDFAALVALPDIDMGTFHLYPDHCKFDTVQG